MLRSSGGFASNLLWDLSEYAYKEALRKAIMTGLTELCRERHPTGPSALTPKGGALCASRSLCVKDSKSANGGGMSYATWDNHLQSFEMLRDGMNQQNGTNLME